MELFIHKLFEAAYMQRWNDKLRPTPFLELDKQAHKMIAAYFIGKFEEEKEGFSWEEIIKGGIFELFQRIVLTDIKPPVFYQIKKDPEKYRKLNSYVCSELKDVLMSVSEEFYYEFKLYFEEPVSNINREVLKAAHLYSSMWEFDIIEEYNRKSYDINEIRKDFKASKEDYFHLKGFREIFLHSKYQEFLDLTGELRYQIRWANLYREPKTSVLGHSLYVAILSYIFSITSDLDIPKEVCKNNFVTGLFHDLPEVLTRDIISPIKRSVEGLGLLIKDIEDEQMERIVYPLLPDMIKDELHLITQHEFDSYYIDQNGKRVSVSADELYGKMKKYSNCRMGELVKAGDELSAYIEATEAIKNGSPNPDFINAREAIIDKYKNITLCNIDFKTLYKNLQEEK